MFIKHSDVDKRKIRILKLNVKETSQRLRNAKM